eukprot:m.194344 g.194344  ORF g.194344 m.194344 type:complete len:178 (+) comp18646_c0_seq4:122-655(+)
MGKAKASQNVTNTGNAVAKKKKIKLAGKILHPNSRKAARVQRGVLRDVKLFGAKKVADKKKLKYGERLLWFQENLDADKAEYTYGEVIDLAVRYIQRNDEELQSILTENKMRGRRCHGNREDLLKLQKKMELEELKVGMKLPDLRNAKVVQQFKAWDLELNLIARFPMELFKHEVRE